MNEYLGRQDRVGQVFFDCMPVLGTPIATMDQPSKIIRVENVTVGFPVRSGVLQRVQRWDVVLDGINVSVARGRTLGLVGESGSGKTTLGRAILGLVPVRSGRIAFQDGSREHVITEMSESRLQPLRRKLQVVFQDPYSSLNPRMRVKDILSEGLRYHFKKLDAQGRDAKCRAALDQVGLAQSSLARYPHEFSGGQRQRISIARALVLDPDFIVCDECVSALDVSIQAQIINLLIDLQDRLGLSYLFISHDLSVVRHISHEIAVLHKGVIVEYGPAQDVSDAPRHDYTRALIAAIPSTSPVHA